MLVLASGCGFVARTHAGNLPHVRQMLREGIAYPGFAFVHVLAACVTYQTPTYANELYARCDTLPEGYDPTDLGAAIARARADRFQLGLLYRRPLGEAVGTGQSTRVPTTDATAGPA
jgi:2-oxoglutarate ferredoxin oxidoreductase subunit beta